MPQLLGLVGLHPVGHDVRVACRVRLREDRQQELEVVHVARHRADLGPELDRHRLRMREVTRVRDDPAPGAQPDDPVEVRRDPDRPAVVGADADRRDARRKRGALAARGAAGGPLGVVRVAGGAVDQVVRVVVQRELGDVGLADQDRPGLAQVRDHRRVLGRDVALEDLRSVAARHPRDLDALLGRERHAVQRPDGRSHRRAPSRPRAPPPAPARSAAARRC